MQTIFHKKTGDSRQVDACDARELIATGRWTAEDPTAPEPAVETPPAGKGAKAGKSEPSSEDMAAAVKAAEELAKSA
jgi:hypothetical protein